ncbi:hypothetical protein J6590_047128 [Homalodisca vitripennis]|nr:hypothetical protein J6590_047128 [Homalodisca vitripennis]
MTTVSQSGLDWQPGVAVVLRRYNNARNVAKPGVAVVLKQYEYNNARSATKVHYRQTLVINLKQPASRTWTDSQVSQSCSGGITTPGMSPRFTTDKL